MVCSYPFQRILGVALSTVMLAGASLFHMPDSQAQPVPDAPGAGYALSAPIPTSQLLAITGVQWETHAQELSIQTSRAFTGLEARDLSILKLPSPHRLLIDIPNARLQATAGTINIQQQGVQRVELSETRTPFYTAVRLVIHVQDGDTLNRLSTAFEGNALKITGLLAPTPVASAAKPTLASAATLNAPIPTAPLTTGTSQTSAPPSAKASGPTSAATPLPPVVAQPSKAIQPTAPTPTTAMAPAPSNPLQALEHQPTPAATGSSTRPATGSSILGTPVPAGMALIEAVQFQNGKLLIQAADQHVLRVKNRFTLNEPRRVVLDLDNAVLADRRLTAPITGHTDDMRQIRVGQFDDTTVRVVIETAYPDSVEAVYPGSTRHILAIDPFAGTSITKLSAKTQLGQVQSIDLKRDGGATILRLMATTPIVHRFLKQDDRIVLDLLNEAAQPTAIGFDAKRYPEILKMRLEPLTEGQPNSKLVLQLASDNIRAVPHLSNDGKTLELILASEQNVSPEIAAMLGGMLPAGKAPFPARIVIDAGHGGKDIGANRSGVNEKDLNLSMALMLRDVLTARGFKVHMTRSTDVFLPLPEITAITNRINPDLFISIHHNASVNPNIHGIETYYYTPQSLALAKKVHNRKINAVSARDGGVKKAMFYVIHHTKVPAILCEVGYVSNAAELRDLQTSSRKIRTVNAIADGVVDYLKARMAAQAN